MYNKRWNPKLMEVFTSEELEELDNVFHYISNDNHKPYQQSSYEAELDDKEEYGVIKQIYEKLFV